MALSFPIPVKTRLYLESPGSPPSPSVCGVAQCVVNQLSRSLLLEWMVLCSPGMGQTPGIANYTSLWCQLCPPLLPGVQRGVFCLGFNLSFVHFDSSALSPIESNHRKTHHFLLQGSVDLEIIFMTASVTW